MMPHQALKDHMALHIDIFLAKILLKLTDQRDPFNMNFVIPAIGGTVSSVMKVFSYIICISLPKAHRAGHAIILMEAPSILIL